MKTLILSLLLTVLLSTQAQAQRTPCAARHLVVEKLGSKYGEYQKSVGIAANGALLEIWVNEDTGTFTIIRTSPTMISCFVASGTHYSKGVKQPKGTLN